MINWVLEEDPLSHLVLFTSMNSNYWSKPHLEKSTIEIYQVIKGSIYVDPSFRDKNSISWTKYSTYIDPNSTWLSKQNKIVGHYTEKN